MTLFFMKTHSDGRDYVVVNLADTSATNVAEMASKLCSPPLGVGADCLVAIKHLEPTQFTVRCLRPDGTGLPPDERMLRCCTRAIEIRYGYKSAFLLADGCVYESRVAGQDIGIRFPASRDVPQRGVYRDWPVAGAGVRFPAGPRGAADLRIRATDLMEGVTGRSGQVSVPAVVALAPALSVRDHRIELENRHEPPAFGPDGPDAAEDTWLYSPAFLVFKGEFPWP